MARMKIIAIALLMAILNFDQVRFYSNVPQKK